MRRTLRRQPRIVWLAASVIGLLGVGASPAGAVGIGHIASGTPPATCTFGPIDRVELDSRYVVPATGGVTNWRITNWTTDAAAGSGQTLTMKVFRQVSGSTYTVVAHDGPRSLTPSGTTGNTFLTSIPVKAGDILGLNDANASMTPNACAISDPGNSFLSFTGDLADNASDAFSPGADTLANIAATVEPEAAPSPGTAPASPGASKKKCKKHKHRSALQFAKRKCKRRHRH